MTQELRSFVEHHLLPQLFFEHRTALLAKFFSNGAEFLAQLYKDVAESNDDISPYVETDFKITPLDLGEYRAISIQPPAPEEALECFLIALCFKIGDGDVENLRYLTLEKAASSPLIEMLKKESNLEQSAPTMMLCEWTKDQTHKNYGRISLDENIGKRIGDILKK